MAPALRLSFPTASTVQLSFAAEPGRTYLVEYSTDLVQWFQLVEITSASGSVVVQDSFYPNAPQRFYRSRTLR